VAHPGRGGEPQQVSVCAWVCVRVTGCWEGRGGRVRERVNEGRGGGFERGVRVQRCTQTRWVVGNKVGNLILLKLPRLHGGWRPAAV